MLKRLVSKLTSQPQSQIAETPYQLQTFSNQGISSLCPETCIVFVTYGRQEIAQQSMESLLKAVGKYRKKIKIVVSDATNDIEKIKWALDCGADDVVLTPKMTSAATSRNVAMSLITDKYSPNFLCFAEDDILYSEDWYPKMVETTIKNFGAVSPFGLAYGMFSALGARVAPERIKEDKERNLNAYIFGAVADQRFLPMSHYATVLKWWDPDLLGISYAQTGGQTFRNAMRGFCGGILKENLCEEIVMEENSTWTGKRNPGPPAHSFDLIDYEPICNAAAKQGFYTEE